MGRKRQSIAISVTLMVALLGTISALSTRGRVRADQTGRADAEAARPKADAEKTRRHRSPIDLVLGPEERWLVTANETADSISLVDAVSGKVLDEIPCGRRPAEVEQCLDKHHVVVSCSFSGEVVVVKVDGQRLQRVSTISVGFEPIGLTVAPDGGTAFVGLAASGEVAELDLRNASIVRRIPVGAWPRHLALSPDGTRLAVGCSGESKIVVVDARAGKVLYDERLSGGINIGRLQCSADGRYVYFPWMVYRSNPISRGNIRRGWVLASRIGRVRLDGPAYREAISLDVPGEAVADPFALAFSPDEKRLVVAASGTHELLVYRSPDLPFVGVGGPGDLIDRRLLADRDLFSRIELGGRPTGVAMSDDGKTVFVANYLTNSVQQVDLSSHKVTREISLGDSPAPDLQRRGMALFYDGRRSLDQWYSCHSCHYNGGVNSKAMDTMNDGSTLTMKTVLPLHNVQHTSPWTWHGWQTDLQEAMHKSFTTTMQGRPVSAEDRKAVVAFLGSLKLPPNPYRNQDGSLTDSAQRGKVVFESRKAGCATCHRGPYLTDGEVHDVGLGSKDDRYEGFNTPSLRGVYRKVRFLHDGRARSLGDVLTGDHAPEDVTGEGKLSPQELADLIEYVKSL